MRIAATILALLATVPVDGSLEAARPSLAAELLRKSAGLSTYRSFVELGQFYLKNGDPARARQILLFGLLHDPSNAAMLTEAARAEVRLGNTEDALTLAIEAHRLEPTAERAWMVRELDRVQAGVGTISKDDFEPIEEPVDATVASTAPAEPATEPATLWAKLRTLHVAQAMEAAVRGYNAGRRPAERMKSFDAEALRKEHLLPGDLDLSSFPVESMTPEGKVKLQGHPPTEELAAATADFEAVLAAASRRSRDGDLTEAVFLLQDARKRFQGEPEVRRRLMHVLRMQERFADALELVESDLKESPDSPELRYERLVLLLELGRQDEAVSLGESLAAEPGVGLHGVLARQVVSLARSGPGKQLEEDLKRIVGAGAQGGREP